MSKWATKVANLGLDWLIDWTTKSEKSVFRSWAKVLLTLKLLKKRKNHSWMIFLLNKIRLVQIRDGMAMGIKRASEWACWCISIWSIKQSIEQLRVRSMCQELLYLLPQTKLSHFSAAKPMRNSIYPTSRTPLSLSASTTRPGARWSAVCTASSTGHRPISWRKSSSSTTDPHRVL